MDFECGCSEIDYILEHLAPEDKQKIPNNIFKFFKENRSIFYKVSLDETKPLDKQELREETKAFLKILYYKFFATEDEKTQFNQYIKDANLPYDIEDWNSIKPKQENIESDKLTTYKENSFLNFLKRIFSFLHKK